MAEAQNTYYYKGEPNRIVRKKQKITEKYKYSCVAAPFRCLSSLFPRKRISSLNVGETQRDRYFESYGISWHPFP